MTGSQQRTPIRGTQLLVEHMGSVFRRPSLIAIEVAWRWLFGIPLFIVGWRQWHLLLTAFPPEASGAGALDTQNPWIAARQISAVLAYYEPHVLAAMGWLLPSAALWWVVVSALGRALLLTKLDSSGVPARPFRISAMILLQAAWLCLFGLTLWGWYESMGWIAATHIRVEGEPDLIGFFIWAIFLSLGFFTAWAVIGWTVSMAPILATLENRSALSALTETLKLGKAFSGKLAEVNLVLGIVKLALVVLAMVFSAAPLPFSDELGPGAMHVVWGGSVLFFVVADDFFQVVRLEAFGEFWKVYRGPAAR
ncbi:MAG: hypothetical protein ABSD70_17455 [Terracidiphilus sp.]